MINETSKNSGSDIELNPISQEHHANIPSTSHMQSPQLNLPCNDLLHEGRRKEYLETCLPLYEASMKGDWVAALGILEEHPIVNLVRYSINRNYETMLHVAVSRRHTKFVLNLVSVMYAEELKLQNNNGNTALCIAVAAGYVEIAQILVQKVWALLEIPGSQGMMPLYMAASSRKHDMVKYLYGISRGMTGEYWTPKNQNRVLLACVEADLFDVAIRIVRACPELIALSGRSVLRVLAQNPHTLAESESESHALNLLRIILENIAELPTTKVDDIIRGPPKLIDLKPTTFEVEESIDETRTYPSSVLFLAAEGGNTRFIVEVIRQYPELVEDVNDNNQTIFHIAISHRYEDIYRLLYEIGSIKDHIITLEDNNGNNMLHLAGIFGEEGAKNSRFEHIPGAAQQMEQELLWFKEVESILPSFLQKRRNFDGFTPHQVFTQNHKHLVSEGEKWMKEIAAQLMVVAALIATISFAAAITFAGGYNQETGSPFFIKNRNFSVFVIVNSLSFAFASASIINVLSLLTSRYAEKDFLKSLPNKLISSLATLFFSIVTMITAFGCNILLLYESRSRMLPITLICMVIIIWCSSIPQMRSFISYMYFSTYGRKNSLLDERKMLFR